MTLAVALAAALTLLATWPAGSSAVPRPAPTRATLIVPRDGTTVAIPGGHPVKLTWFQARYTGACDQCRNPIYEGSWAAYDRDGALLCQSCAEDSEEGEVDDDA